MKYQILIQELTKTKIYINYILTKCRNLAIIIDSDVTNDKLWIKTQKWGVKKWRRGKEKALASQIQKE